MTTTSAVVTGAASDVGHAPAVRRAAAGTRLVLADVHAAALAEVAADLHAAAIPTDVADPLAMRELAAAVPAPTVEFAARPVEEAQPAHRAILRTGCIDGVAGHRLVRGDEAGGRGVGKARAQGRGELDSPSQTSASERGAMRGARMRTRHRPGHGVLSPP